MTQLEAIPEDITIKRSPSGRNWQATLPSGEVIATGVSFDGTARMAHHECERKRSARGLNPGEVALGNGLVYSNGHTFRPE